MNFDVMALLAALERETTVRNGVISLLFELTEALKGVPAQMLTADSAATASLAAGLSSMVSQLDANKAKLADVVANVDVRG